MFGNIIHNKEMLKRLTNYSDEIQKKLIDLATLGTVIFYMILESDGRVYQLSAGDVAKIDGSHPSKAMIFTEQHSSGFSAFQYCGWKQVRVNEDSIQHILNEPIPFASPTKIKENISESERKTLLKIIYGMAIDKYGYDPSASRKEATGSNRNSIASRLNALGLDVTDDTVRKYLTEAHKLYPHAKPPKS